MTPAMMPTAQSAPDPPAPGDSAQPPAPVRVFGRGVVDWHDRFWALRRCRVVRPGDPRPAPHAALYLLLPPRALVSLPTEPISEILGWVRPRLLSLRLTPPGSADPAPARGRRCAWTPDRRLAAQWAGGAGGPKDRRALRRAVRADRRWARRLPGSLHDAARAPEAAAWLGELIQAEPDPQALFPQAPAHAHAPGVFLGENTHVPPAARLAGPLWIGAGHNLPPQSLHGPRVLPDTPAIPPANTSPNPPT